MCYLAGFICFTSTWCSSISNVPTWFWAMGISGHSSSSIQHVDGNGTQVSQSISVAQGVFSKQIKQFPGNWLTLKTAVTSLLSLSRRRSCPLSCLWSLGSGHPLFPLTIINFKEISGEGYWFTVLQVLWISFGEPENPSKILEITLRNIFSASETDTQTTDLLCVSFPSLSSSRNIA